MASSTGTLAEGLYPEGKGRCWEGGTLGQPSSNEGKNIEIAESRGDRYSKIRSGAAILQENGRNCGKKKWGEDIRLHLKTIERKGNSLNRRTTGKKKRKRMCGSLARYRKEAKRVGESNSVSESGSRKKKTLSVPHWKKRGAVAPSWP